METILDQRALVLNRSWVAIDTTTVRRAIVWIYRGIARAVNPETYEAHDFESWADLSVVRDQPTIRTINLQIRVPEVILLQMYNEVPRKEVVFSRRNIYKRDKYTCQYCGARPGSEELSIDHVVPRAQGGHSTWTNCVLACVECNKRKANRTPPEAGLRLLREPVRPPWTPLVSVRLGTRRASWERFLSEKYWNTELVD